MKLDKKQNTVSVGLAGCVGLLSLLLVSLVTPLASGQAYADEGTTDTNGNESTEEPQTDESGAPDAQSDDTGESDGATGPSKAAARAATASTVNIAFNPTAANGTVTPVDASGAKAKVDVTATVRVQNSGGYSVYVGSSSSQLKAGSNVIDSVTSSTTYENMPLNRWGYSFAQGTTASNTYNAMPATLRGTALYSNNSTNIKDETKTYTLSFAVNIGADKPAGTYTNQVTMSVVSSPLEISDLTGLANMQDMTSEVCAASATGATAQLKDTRDGKYYWVTKLADGKCWMTQNLDLDLSTSTALTPATSDVSSNWTPAYTTATQANSGTILADNTGQRSWSLGNYRITNPTTSSDCGYPKNDLSQCTSQFTAYNTPTTANGEANAHYIVGNHYQWNAATAGTGGTITSGQATSSICPKGWKLPESNATTAGTFGGLINAYSIGSDVAKLTSSPLYFVRGGDVWQNTSALFEYAGSGGSYWSSTPHSNGTNAYYLYFYGTSSVNPSGNWDRRGGLSVRCLVR